ncbi:MAG: DUF3343 domain-containing protein [Oscillospiraceae bacterium]|nr:DUF3343 domain-containing protein [Oscillospiraceae bacterium]
MGQIWILCRSLTYAQRAAELLERKGITATVSRAPQGSDPRGCGHAVTVRKRGPEAVKILRDAHLPFGKLLARGEDGGYREVEL